jgi:hypothetical protein
LKTLQYLLGHSSIVVTADTYTPASCRRSSAAAFFDAVSACTASSFRAVRPDDPDLYRSAGR